MSTLTALIVALFISLPAFADNKHITILGTNDIHGGVDPITDKDGQALGGLSYLSGAVKAIRSGVTQKYGSHGGVLLLDGGDQFQGTLVSNFNEGKLLFSLFNKMGYDAAVPGNHDYDFGPAGWLEDQSSDPTRRREVIESLAKTARFKLLSANTFYRHSLSAGSSEILSNYCQAAQEGVQVDFSKAKRPSFLKPYLIRRVAGIRVAIIGIDHPKTVDVTTRANVEDLCFNEEVASYLSVRKSLEGKADIFVMLIHHGNTKTEKPLIEIVKRLTEKERMVDAVVSGHTHFTLNETVNGVPIIQSGFGGTQFGRIDLVWDTAEKKLKTAETKAWAGVKTYHKKCDTWGSDFCELKEGTPHYDGFPLVEDASIKNIIAKAKKEVAPLADRVMGEALHDHPKDRISENLAGNLLTDLLRTITKADIAILNMGGIREAIQKGVVTYEKLFRVFPFSNHTLVVGPMPAKNILSLVRRNITTCGAKGTITQSGAKVVFERHCELAVNGEDKNAKLVSVEMLDGTRLFGEGVAATPELNFTIATVDFIAAGGEGNTEFAGVPVISDAGILREQMTDYLLGKGMRFGAEIDGRWKNLTP